MQTPLGQILSNVIMLLGYSIIVVPTGIVVTAGTRENNAAERECPACGADGHAFDAAFCRKCGGKLPKQVEA